MNYKFLPFAIGMALASTAANAESFEEVTTESLTASEASISKLSVNNRIYMTSIDNRSTYGLHVGISKNTERYGNFIECVDHRIGAHNTMFKVSENGRVGCTGLSIRETSADHCCSPALGISFYDDKNKIELSNSEKVSGFLFSTSSYPGGPGEKYYPMIFQANQFIFDKGDMVVNGKITCKDELNVTAINTSSIKTDDINVNMSNVADYVFDENYNLKSLSEVESYVNEHKHLPGIPSAAEIEQNGVSLSKMSNMLLEKVEELTLHLIRLEKENAELKAKFESLEK